MNNQNKKKSLSKECVICSRTIEEAGGHRIVAKYNLSIGLSITQLGGGNPEYPYKTIGRYTESYIVIKGKKELWTEELIEYVKNEFDHDRHPWFCQKCANQICRVCGSPVQILHGYDTISEGWCVSHAPIHPVPAGCLNPDCEKHRMRRLNSQAE